MALKTNLCELSQCCWIQVSKHVTSEMCSVLHYTAERGCMAKIGEAWLGPPAQNAHEGTFIAAEDPSQLRLG